MLINNSVYNRFHLVKEMYETVDYIRVFKNTEAKDLISRIPAGMPLMITGEGSSRIYPAKNAVHQRLRQMTGPVVMTESSTDLAGMNLEGFAVIGASNSGRTRELINLFRELKNSGHRHLYGLTCNPDTLLEKYSDKAYLIDAGIEKAVAASKSVVAQALFYDALLSEWYEEKGPDTSLLSGYFEKALSAPVDRSVTEMICRAQNVYFTGNNNGVAEELTLKTNEIIRKRSSYLPGTYLLHGVEEVISSNDIIIMVDAYQDEFDKIRSIYSVGIGTPVVAISTGDTPFHTIKIPSVPSQYETYIKLATGWNLLVEAGIELGIDIDKPSRARKIGNEASE
jgi:glutamine---fructose-6-phosphate transaminase (isomerizing)